MPGVVFCKVLPEHLIKQNDDRLPVSIKKYGCYFRSLQAIVELTVGVPLLVDQIIGQWAALQEMKGNNGIFPAMASNCWINSPDTVMNSVAKIFTDTWSFCQIGVQAGGRAVFWDWVRNKEFDFVVLEWKTDNGEHFTLADKFDNEIFDPWSGPINKKGVIKRILYQCNRTF